MCKLGRFSTESSKSRGTGEFVYFVISWRLLIDNEAFAPLHSPFGRGVSWAHRYLKLKGPGDREYRYGGR